MTKSERQRARRDQRLSDPTPMRLTERDLDVLQAVYAYDELTTQQLQTLFFPSAHTAYARLSLLFITACWSEILGCTRQYEFADPLRAGQARRGKSCRRSGSEVGWSNATARSRSRSWNIRGDQPGARRPRQSAVRTRWLELIRWQGENELKGD